MRRSARVLFGVMGLGLLFALPLCAASPGGAAVGGVPFFARAANDFGVVDPTLPLEHITLLLRRSAEKQTALERFLADQQDPSSRDYHHWLTPQEFGLRFGPSCQNLDRAKRWLTSQGFTVEGIAKGGTWITFSGTVADVEHAFHTQIHNYLVGRKLYYANAVAPSMPAELASVAAGILSLNNYPLQAMHTPPVPVSTGGPQPELTLNSAHYVAPGDFATIYDVNPLYNATPAIDGTGVTIAIVGRTNPTGMLDAVHTFQKDIGLPVHAPTITINLAAGDPGDLGLNEDEEAELDVEWSGAVAKNATINFVTSKSGATDGVDLSAQYIVDNQLAPVMSTSFGACESSMGSGENLFYNNLWQQAAAEGITAFVSAGDSGASGCDAGGSSTGSGVAVNGLATTPYNVCVGGTEFNEGSGTYWNPPSSSNFTSALSYIPEMAWNESGAAPICPSGDTCSNLWATGGGVSTVYSKPSWQASPGVPADGMRDVPDVSLAAAGGHDGALVYIEDGSDYNAFYFIGGTSWSSPSWAGVMALVVQATGQWQGNANYSLYRFGNSEYTTGSPAVFHDTTTGNNSVPGVTGYSCTTAYDLATGLGTPDVSVLVNNWSPCPAISLSPANLAVGTAGLAYPSTTFTQAGGVGAITWSENGALPAGMSFTDNGDGTAVLSGTPTVTGTFAITVTATDANGCKGSQSYTLGIVCPKIVLSPPSPLPGATAGAYYTQPVVASGGFAPLPGATAGVYYTQTVVASGGFAPYTYSVPPSIFPGVVSRGPNGIATPNALPPGLSLDPNSGVISGTPSATGQYSFWIDVKDWNGCEGSQGYTLMVVCPVITVTSSSSPVPSGAVGDAYGPVTFTAAGSNSGSYLFSTSGSLPTGLTLTDNGNGTATLSGTPTGAGTFAFSVVATDAYGCSGSLDVNLFISLYNTSFQDDYGRSDLCVNSTTGAWQWTVLKGNGAGQSFSGPGTIVKGSGYLRLEAAPGSGFGLTLIDYTTAHRATATFTYRPDAVSSALYDQDTTNDQSCGGGPPPPP